MKNLFTALTVAALLAACDFLDTESAGFVPPESSYQDEKGVEMALTGVYAPLADLSFYGRDWFYAFNLQDDLSYYDRNYTKQELFLNNYTPTNATLNNLWSNLYTGIDRANSFLEHIQGSPLDPALVTRYTGEVRFLRAYYYFTLASLWGDVPLRLQSTRDAPDALQMPATPAAELFRFVASEMEGVVDLVEPADRLAGPGRISRSAIQGILARVYLKMGGFPTRMGKEAYEKAAYWARQVVGSGLHGLHPSYEELFTNLCRDRYDTKYRENIWEIEFKGNNQDGHTTGGCVGSYNGVYNNQNDSHGFGYGYVSITLKLFDLYDAADTRRDWNICQYYYRNGEKLWRNLQNRQYVYCNAGKFRREYELSGTKDKDYTPINFPALRYADVLLMLAEAENEAYGGPTDRACAALDEVRRRADPACDDLAGMDQAAFRQAIIDERARELCFEGLRKGDLIRWGLYVEAMTTERRAQLSDPRWHPNKQYAGAIADHTEYRHNWYPIPSKELATNFRIKQNPLW